MKYKIYSGRRTLDDLSCSWNSRFIGLFKDVSICFKMETRFTIIYSEKWKMAGSASASVNRFEQRTVKSPCTLGKQVKELDRRFMH